MSMFFTVSFFSFSSSDGLHPTSDGLQPNYIHLYLLACIQLQKRAGNADVFLEDVTQSGLHVP